MAALSLSTSALGLAHGVAPPRGSPSISMMAKATGKDTLIALAEEQQIPMGFWDPLKLADKDFWSEGNDATVGWLRHAEIKHGRVAMAAFVGFCVQSNGIHFPWDIKGGILGDAATALSYGDLSAIPAPVDQWAAVPTAGKLQILGTIAVLEFVGETMEPHYMRGGKPGFYPSLKDAAGGGKGNIPHPVPLDLYDPFGFFEGDSEEKKARGRNVEINNGRAAMLGIFGLICASKGLIVPGLDSLGIAQATAEPMSYFGPNDAGLPFVENMLKFDIASFGQPQ
ncbi:light harvesting protein, partial [Emiliania huxleyi CCMP1516]|jgi:hypothetical protein|uniref:Light harvesting protein n=3 Tax=Emiliania huxleyi TaxID=2903 RepID=A0A0D3KJJ3_EMIH1